ncbi:MAG: hypothetical protein V4538_15530 [Bacteroidota bacterium]
MISSNELRIGNIVLGSAKIISRDLIQINTEAIKTPFVLSKIPLGILFKDSKCEKYFDPIPLTESILLQIGTKSKQFSSYENEYKWIIELNNQQALVACNNDNSISFYSEGAIYGHCVVIKYLHDLQNQYYFNNEKTELPININTLKI